MRIGLLSYALPHRKTQEVTLRLFARATHEYVFIECPFVRRPVRKVAFEHRPGQFEGPTLLELCSFYGVTRRSLGKNGVFDGLDYCLILGSSLIPEDLIRPNFLINCHPGVIPAVRGLDSFKWAILNNAPLGISLHFIDAEVDKGELISIVETPIFPTDTIELLARRHYELELEMLANVDYYLENGKRPEFREGPAHKRMPIETEQEMLKHFDTYRDMQYRARQNAACG